MDLSIPFYLYYILYLNLCVNVCVHSCTCRHTFTYMHTCTIHVHTLRACICNKNTYMHGDAHRSKCTFTICEDEFCTVCRYAHVHAYSHAHTHTYALMKKCMHTFTHMEGQFLLLSPHKSGR